MAKGSSSLEACFDYKARVIKEKTIQQLWAGYGTCKQVTVRNEGDGSTRSYVVKMIQPPEGSGVSHERKVRSYEVEAYFYERLATPELRAVCPLPEPVHVGLGSCGGRDLTLVMGDLRDGFPASSPGTHRALDLEAAKAGLTWLAKFHAFFWQQPRPEGVWEQGCYWYLDTRLEELESTDRDWRALKDAAREVDAAVKGLLPSPGSSTGGGGGGAAGANPRFRTLVHGDFKAANLLWRHPGDGSPPECAACDFQYCGEGYGMRDVAYFFTSAVSPRTLQQHEGELLRHYHAQLAARLPPERAAEYTMDVATEHFELCLLDFVRFMAGWGWWGNSDWAAAKARKTLAGRFGR